MTHILSKWSRTVVPTLLIPYWLCACGSSEVVLNAEGDEAQSSTQVPEGIENKNGDEAEKQEKNVITDYFTKDKSPPPNTAKKPAPPPVSPNYFAKLDRLDTDNVEACRRALEAFIKEHGSQEEIEKKIKEIEERQAKEDESQEEEASSKEGEERQAQKDESQGGDAASSDPAPPQQEQEGTQKRLKFLQAALEKLLWLQEVTKAVEKDMADSKERVVELDKELEECASEREGLQKKIKELLNGRTKEEIEKESQMLCAQIQEHKQPEEKEGDALAKESAERRKKESEENDARIKANEELLREVRRSKSEIEDLDKKIKGKERDKDLEEILQVALLGNAAARYKLSCKYQTISRTEESIKWLTKAAYQGYVDAQQAMGERCYNGLDHEGKTHTRKDYGKAMEWFLKAAEQEYPDAQYHIGYMHQNGLGVPEDPAKALLWYREAAKYSHEGAIKMVKILSSSQRGMRSWLQSFF